MNGAERPLPTVQRAYFYLVALVAIHMVVLAVANLLRVGAELALGAPSGGFTGLPFVFNEFSRPRDLYREQASLAIAHLEGGGAAGTLVTFDGKTDALRTRTITPRADCCLCGTDPRATTAPGGRIERIEAFRYVQPAQCAEI